MVRNGGCVLFIINKFIDNIYLKMFCSFVYEVSGIFSLLLVVLIDLNKNDYIYFSF